jgi:hypothetical protein
VGQSLELSNARRGAGIEGEGLGMRLTRTSDHVTMGCRRYVLTDVTNATA